jgi:hypothetical protein
MNSMPARCKAVWIAFTASSETNLRSFSKSTTVDRPNLGALIQSELAFYRVRISQTRLPRCAIGKSMNAICAARYAQLSGRRPAFS